ncbi:hypothetical protein [Priestia megaterium]|jgi:hypothetical protein|uniref:Uncharacterized protein n=1 Tax=Priestia megaterium TaxID=1404 RepID=A0A3D8WUS8_PRIMG|nr:hypothetical protein [Priestia megaterium]MDH3142444.1 hypothetical protein [Priestia megaterium]MDH3173287.1 hypothetical protein [Priestia megaterium]MED4235796.1 hypothetical protein [Priestia megaterium]MED4255172.1 hypothetical protein [Priestia megaterium]MED4265481.1 hypothetical protein [Priestia megaterium]
MHYDSVDKNLAIKLAKDLIQNPNVKPIYTQEGIGFAFNDTVYSFSDLVSYFLDNIEKIKEW